jgi:hypothetical protein
MEFAPSEKFEFPSYLVWRGTETAKPGISIISGAPKRRFL